MPTTYSNLGHATHLLNILNLLVCQIIQHFCFKLLSPSAVGTIPEFSLLTVLTPVLKPLRGGCVILPECFHCFPGISRNEITFNLSRLWEHFFYTFHFHLICCNKVPCNVSHCGVSNLTEAHHRVLVLLPPWWTSNVRLLSRRSRDFFWIVWGFFLDYQFLHCYRVGGSK